MVLQKLWKAEPRHPIHVATNEGRIAKEGNKPGDVGSRKASESLVFNFLAAGLEGLEILSNSSSVENNLRYQIVMRRADGCGR